MKFAICRVFRDMVTYDIVLLSPQKCEVVTMHTYPLRCNFLTTYLYPFPSIQFLTTESDKRMALYGIFQQTAII